MDIWSYASETVYTDTTGLLCILKWLTLSSYVNIFKYDVIVKIKVILREFTYTEPRLQRLRNSVLAGTVQTNRS
jgi:hypothetical protein